MGAKVFLEIRITPVPSTLTPRGIFIYVLGLVQGIDRVSGLQPSIATQACFTEEPGKRRDDLGIILR